MLLAVAVAIFLTWRFTRELNIYGISEDFARPKSLLAAICPLPSTSRWMKWNKRQRSYDRSTTRW